MGSAKPDHAKHDLVFVVPLYNDWEALQILLARLAKALGKESGNALVIIVDDASTQDPARSSADPQLKSFVLRLRTNLGHQRAISVGLVKAVQEAEEGSYIVVMDADGEDRPEDVLLLLSAARANAGRMVLAQRNKRQESLRFRIGYWIYRLAFWALSGARIRHGNFSAIPVSVIRSLIYKPELWNHFAATLNRSNHPRVELKIDRGERYAGGSQMNFTKLLIHGLSAVSVYTDVMGVRLLVASLAVTGFAIAGATAVVAVKFLTSLAIPGWASTLTGIMGLLAVLGMIWSTTIVFLVLQARDKRPFIPALDASALIETYTEMT